MITIRQADLTDPQVVTLITEHQQAMLAASPPGFSFALDLSGLVEPSVTVLAAWAGERLAAIGALKRLGGAHAELKSMRTHAEYLRRGIARIMLAALIEAARAQGIERLSLETGSGPQFEPALALYRQRGFVNGPAFAGYVNTDFNQCLHLTL